MILLRNVLDEIESGEPFHLTVITCDQKRNTGGKIVRFGPAILNQVSKKKRKSSKPVTTVRRNNNYNNTRTIRLLGSEEIRTIHVQLITEFNNQRVI
jgi:hypothetical protein